MLFSLQSADDSAGARQFIACTSNRHHPPHPNVTGPLQGCTPALPGPRRWASCHITVLQGVVTALYVLSLCTLPGLIQPSEEELCLTQQETSCGPDGCRWAPRKTPRTSSAFHLKKVQSPSWGMGKGVAYSTPKVNVLKIICHLFNRVNFSRLFLFLSS